MFLSKIKSVWWNFRKILRRFVVKCVLNGISLMKLLMNLVLRLLLIPKLRGNHLTGAFFKLGGERLFQISKTTLGYSNC